MSTFSSLSLIGPLLKNLKELGYESPTKIQIGAIPLLLDGHDLLALAQTGTGKSAAFCLPILQKLSEKEDKGIRALVLVPTRELATQIKKSFDQYGNGLGIPSLALFGGVDQKEQESELRAGVKILVATPGRLIDLVKQRKVQLKNIEMLVLDEADRMLDMGFKDDIDEIISFLPSIRQSMFFSATMGKVVGELAERLLVNPKRVEVHATNSAAPKIEQKVYYCKKMDKFQLLKKILKEEQRNLVVVFTKTKEMADKVKEYLRFHRIASGVFHGDKKQKDREQSLHHFKDGGLRILIATDIAARGLDVPGISHVINFEFPMEAQNYVHRIGRTGRAGEQGKAISFCDESEKPILEQIQKLIQFKIPTENFKGLKEAPGPWLQDGPIIVKKLPTPGQSQEKSAFLDHSKRQKVVVAKNHPGFKNSKKKKK